MFVFSMKTTRPRVIATAAVLVGLVGTMLVLSAAPAVKPSAAKASGMDDTARRQFLQTLGYETGTDEAQVREIMIPADFDDAFTAYNEIQKEAGTDLSGYRGKRVKCWTYTVTNLPDDDTVLAHLYVYKDQVIGGDISSTRQEGFCRGLSPLTAANG